MPKCLLCITGAFHTGGGIAALNRLVIKALSDEGYSLDILALGERDPKIDSRYLSSDTWANYRVFGGSKVAFALAAWKAVLLQSFDYVFVDHVNLASILAPLARLKLVKYIVWMCGIEVFPPRPDFEGRLGMVNASMRLAISGFTCQSVASRFPKLSIEVCELALDPVRHAGASQRTASVQAPIILRAIDNSMAKLGTRTILNVGRMGSREQYKGQNCLIRAFATVQDKFPDAQLVLAGGGDDLPRLRGLAASLPSPIRNRIFMPGYVGEDLLDQLYSACFVFAMPSMAEGFGLVYLEAMRHGKPCLGGTVDATPCLVRHGTTGLLVEDPSSPRQVADALLRFLSHPEEACQMGEAGQDLVREKYLFPHFKQRFFHSLGD